jgi:hypothetical protein
MGACSLVTMMLFAARLAVAANSSSFLSPTALTASCDGKTLKRGRSIVWFVLLAKHQKLGLNIEPDTPTIKGSVPNGA